MIRASRFVCWALLISLAGCAGPMAIYSAIRPEDQTVYDDQVLYTSMPEKQAFLAWRASQRGQSTEQAREADAALDRGPFKRDDREAISLGAIIYMNHCMSCHGELADGHGRSARPGAAPQDFTALSARLEVLSAKGAPAEWFDAVHDGAGPWIEYEDGVSPAMPAFGDELANEQIWLVLTYLASDRGKPVTLAPAPQ